MLLPVLFVQFGDLRHQRVIRIRIRQQRADGQQHFADRQRRAPLALQDVKANAPVRVHVAVVDLGDELQLRRLERVVGGEIDLELEDTPLIRRLARADDGRFPREQVGRVGRTSAAVGGRLLGQVLQLLVDTLCGSHW